MQLPEELERIVRDFSKPLLRYPREYKLAVVANKKEWPELKRKLSSPEADHFVWVLRLYLEARDTTKRLEHRYDSYVMSDTFSTSEISLEERVKIRQEWVDSMGNELELGVKLRTMVEL